MCLFVAPGTQAVVASEDIEVYKVVFVHSYAGDEFVEPYTMFLSPFQDFEYEIGKEYESELTRSLGKARADADAYPYPCAGYDRVEEGLHTFANLKEAREYVAYAAFRLRGSTRRTMAILRCVIPDGSVVFSGDWEYSRAGKYTLVASYASNKLKVIDIVEKVN